MTGTAITFLVLSATLIWGGLVAAVVLLRHDTRRAGSEPDGD